MRAGIHGGAGVDVWGASYGYGASIDAWNFALELPFA
jgi:hypothetical protein